MIAKQSRAQRGEALRVLDMFSGCGGFSLGFKRAGFELVGALERDATAVRTHARQFFGPAASPSFEKHAVPWDAVRTSPGALLKSLGASSPSTAVDVIVAGPPCQSYARIGRAKLGALASDPNAFLHDRRGRLYGRLVYYVQVLKPLAVVFENVLDVLNQAGTNVVEDLAADLSGLGYSCSYTILNAAHHGVPQMRERVFLVAYANQMGARPGFPAATHRLSLPDGYRLARHIALQTIAREGGGFDSKYFVEPRDSGNALTPAVSSEDALGDLPRVGLDELSSMRHGPRRFDTPLPYGTEANTPFQQQARSWPGFKGSASVLDHVTRRLPRDYPIFERMRAGDQYPEAHQIATNVILTQALADASLSHDDSLPDSPRYEAYLAIKKQTVPPYDPDRFVDKWRKMDRSEPARTLTAHLGKDSYTHIHYDDDQPRTITVREAARLQSFPDGFVFEGAMNAAFRQIGNAVPPLLAFALARNLRQEIQCAVGDAPTWAGDGHSQDASLLGADYAI